MSDNKQTQTQEGPKEQKSSWVLNKNVLTVIMDIAGTKEWLRLRQVSKEFNEAAFFMKNFKVQSMSDKSAKLRLTQQHLLANGLEVQILQLNAIIDVSFNQQLRRAFPNQTNSKMPAMQKRNI